MIVCPTWVHVYGPVGSLAVDASSKEGVLYVFTHFYILFTSVYTISFLFLLRCVYVYYMVYISLYKFMIFVHKWCINCQEMLNKHVKKIKHVTCEKTQ